MDADFQQGNQLGKELFDQLKKASDARSDERAQLRFLIGAQSNMAGAIAGVLGPALAKEVNAILGRGIAQLDENEIEVAIDRLFNERRQPLPHEIAAFLPTLMCRLENLCQRIFAARLGIVVLLFPFDRCPTPVQFVSNAESQKTASLLRELAQQLECNPPALPTRN